ncbi:membrane hypothetical protein [Vibrio nigripulchritudo SOn1]|uniref:TrbC/VIRB2 family protein n=1 Tax=Vibrio nigripulchritudo SOn1 TaxID=1238450 RepID=A0AAV2VQ75_9VIBR|nr:hypothetical protein [Vibrio nigripulchritudo]CCO46802.1 membrane hypothetical protein [Vibrio nigripulchritudo SOn1]
MEKINRVLKRSLKRSMKVTSGLVAFVSFGVFASSEDAIPDLVEVLGNADKVTVAATKSAYNVSFLIAIFFGIAAVLVFAASLSKNGDQSKTKGIAAGLFLVSIISGGIGTWQNIGNKSLTGQTTEVSTWMTEIQSEIPTE